MTRVLFIPFIALVALSLSAGRSTAQCPPDEPWEHEAQLIAGDGERGDLLGFSVAASQERVIVGAYRNAETGEDAGAAYVHERSGGRWTLEAKLVGSAREGDFFGISVDLDGDRAVVGALFGVSGGVRAGASHVYERDGATWSETARLTATDGEGFEEFGAAVAVSGDWIAVGAPREDEAGMDSGAVYVFELVGGTWVERQKLLPPPGSLNQRFGNAVSLSPSGEVLAVGAFQDSTRTTTAGAAYVYHRERDVYVERSVLLPVPGERNNQFGISVAADDDMILVGAQLDDSRGLDAGAVYVHELFGGDWALTQKLAEGGDGDWFGSAVGLSGDFAVVGASQADAAGEDSGQVQLFEQSGGAWRLRGPLRHPDPASEDEYGDAADVDGDVAVGGAPLDDERGSESGSAQVFSCNAVVPTGPDCDAGEDVVAPCEPVPLMGTADSPTGVLNSVQWTSSCPDTVFSPSDDVLDPVVFLGDTCGLTCVLTLTVEDDGGTCSDEVEVTVDDDLPPELDGVPADLMLGCDEAVPAPPTVTGIDDCDPAPAVAFDEQELPGACADERTITRTWTATDRCGNAASASQTITIRDDDPPAITGVPADATLSCGEPLDAPAVRAIDACDPAPSLGMTEERTDGSCPDTYTLLQRWTATDRCGNESTEERTVEVRDVEGPSLVALLVPTEALPPRSAGAPASACSPPSSRELEIVASATDDCDPMPALATRLLAHHHDVLERGGPCRERTDVIDVAPGDVVEIRLLAPPCPAKPPKSPRPSLSVRSDGVRVVMGERVELEVLGADRCGNTSAERFDPASNPSPLDDEVLDDGTSCPAIAGPRPPKCKVDPCP